MDVYLLKNLLWLQLELIPSFRKGICREAISKILLSSFFYEVDALRSDHIGSGKVLHENLACLFVVIDDTVG